MRPTLDIIDLLLGEHASLLALFRHLEIGLPAMSLKEIQISGATLEAMLMAHAIEEDSLLFHALPIEQGGVKETLDAMFTEHSEQRRLLEQLRVTRDAAQARSRLRHLVELTREHFAVEERVLFGLAKRLLGQDRLEELGEEFARRRGIGRSF